jgi:hypothetical protein
LSSPSLSGGPSFEPAPRFADLSLLSLSGRVLAFVVAAEEEDEPLAMGMAEHPDEKLLLTQSKLEEAPSQLAAERGRADVDPLMLEDLS